MAVEQAKRGKSLSVIRGRGEMKKGG